MSIKEIKEQIHLLTTVKLILEIDNRINEWTNEDEVHLMKLKSTLYNVNTMSNG